MDYKKQKYTWAGNFNKSGILQEQFEAFTSHWKSEDINGKKFYDFSEIRNLKTFLNFPLIREIICRLWEEFNSN